jgi:hypothetical protein
MRSAFGFSLLVLLEHVHLFELRERGGGGLSTLSLPRWRAVRPRRWVLIPAKAFSPTSSTRCLARRRAEPRGAAHPVALVAPTPSPGSFEQMAVPALKIVSYFVRQTDIFVLFHLVRRSLNFFLDINIFLEKHLIL